MNKTFPILIIILSILISVSYKSQGLPAEICQYANNAEATSEASGYEAIYSTGEPNGDGNCSTQPSLYTSWRKINKDISTILTLTFQNSIYPSNLTVFGDHELCISRVWLLRNNSWHLVIEDYTEVKDKECIKEYSIAQLNFKTNMARLETCGQTWSAIDAVKLCGSIQSFPNIKIEQPTQDIIINNLVNSTTIRISTDLISKCEFSYDKNFNFNEGIDLSTVDGIIHSYNLAKPISMDSIEIYYKCKGENGKVNPYSVMHRFNLRDINSAFIGICEWRNCSAGAVSISIDEDWFHTLTSPYATCKEELEARNLRGTYFLPYTNLYETSDWRIWVEAYNNSHEIGGHSQKHNCSYTQDKVSFTNDIQNNINDILGNIHMPRYKLVSYAWPCGVAHYQYQEWLSDYYLFARGYHSNSIESKNPENFMDYKSINSIGMDITPRDYYLLADVTENYQGWVNYIYQGSCNNPEVMDYLLTKDLWVMPIGIVSKYIMERNSVRMQNIQKTETGIRFYLINPLNTTIYNQELTLKIYLGDGDINNIRVDGANAEFAKFKIGNQTYVKFNLLPKINEIEINGSGIQIPYCGDGKVNQGSEECDDANNITGDGCSDCKKEEIYGTYIILYVGNIDGNAPSHWYPFYDRITKYFEDNQLPIGFSFFPASIHTGDEFAGIFKRMYLAGNIELFQKGFTMNKTEEHLDELPFEKQKEMIKAGQYYYIDKMKEILNSTKVNIPVTYVAPFSRFTTTTRRALEELGFHTNFGLYYASDLAPVESTATLDSIQYGISFTVSGTAGRHTTFKQPDEIIQEIISYDRADVKILKVNGRRVIPLFAHQPDFEDPVIDGKIDETKWKIYNETIMKLLKNPNIKFVNPSEVWKMRHPVCMPTNIPETFCNRIDDDCDGSIDEGFETISVSCGIGACQSNGILECVGYEIANCTAGMPASNDSTCDGIDNDCDGLIDEQCLRPIILNSGWNLISIPIELENKSVKNIFKEVRYTDLLTYTDDRWYKLNNNSLINETRGYWINSIGNQTLIIEGTGFTYPTNFILTKGWNLISYPSLNSTLINEILKDFNYSIVYSYNRTWLSYVPSRKFNTLKYFVPGYGYWINAE